MLSKNRISCLSYDRVSVNLQKLQPHLPIKENLLAPDYLTWFYSSPAITSKLVSCQHACPTLRNWCPTCSLSQEHCAPAPFQLAVPGQHELKVLQNGLNAR